MTHLSYRIIAWEDACQDDVLIDFLSTKKVSKSDLHVEDVFGCTFTTSYVQISCCMSLTHHHYMRGDRDVHLLDLRPLFHLMIQVKTDPWGCALFSRERNYSVIIMKGDDVLRHWMRRTTSQDCIRESKANYKEEASQKMKEDYRDKSNFASQSCMNISCKEDSMWGIIFFQEQGDNDFRKEKVKQVMLQRKE